MCRDGSHYFDQLDARCHDCQDATARAVTTLCIVTLLLLAGYVFSTAINRGWLSCNALRMRAEVFQDIWRRAGMRHKVKALVGFYQCASAVPSVFNVLPPPGLDEYTRCMSDITLSKFHVSKFRCIPALGHGREGKLHVHVVARAQVARLPEATRRI